MNNYETLMNNYETIKTFSLRYRHQLTVYAGVFGEHVGLCKADDYIRFADQLNDSTFVGNNFVGIMVPMIVDEYREVLDGRLSIEEYLSNRSVEDVMPRYYELV